MLEEIPYLLPINFLDISVDIKKTKKKLVNDNSFLLPSTSLFTDEDECKVYCGWNKDFLAFRFIVSKKIEKVIYPEYNKGDSIEIFIDTRNIKTYGHVTKFCHHFIVLPDKKPFVKEVTRFLPDDMHILASEEDFKVILKSSKKEYIVDLVILEKALFGYEVDRFKKIGFNYRINRLDNDPIHFSSSSTECKIEKMPAFFATLLLKE